MVDVLEWAGFNEDTKTRKFVRWCGPNAVWTAEKSWVMLKCLAKYTALLVGAILYFTAMLLTTVLVNNVMVPMSRLLLTFFIKTHGEGHHGRVTCLATFMATEDESVESPGGDESESDGDVGFGLGASGGESSRSGGSSRRGGEDSDEPPTLKLMTGSDDCAVVR